MEVIRNGKAPLVAAHRGTSGGNIPCNSRAAYLAAIQSGADIVELDVSVSLDRKLYAFHPFMEFAHVNLPTPIEFLLSGAVSLKSYTNQDRMKTKEKVLTLDEALQLLKDKCIVNVDKFWTAPKEIADCIRKNGMEKQVIIKTPASEKHIKAVEMYAPEMPYMVMVKEKDDISAELLKRKVNFIGIEAIFRTESAQVVSDEHIKWLHEKGLAIWGNSIVYNMKDVIAAGHTDDVAMTGDPDFGWGWFREKDFDIVQTDWVPSMKQYFKDK